MPLRPRERSNYRKPKTILVVDDSEHILRGVHHVTPGIVAKGHKVVTTANYADAVRAIKEHRPDLVFTDFQLARSGPTGFHVAAEAKKANPKSEVRVHSLAAADLRAADPEILKRFNLRKRDIYDKHRLGHLLGLSAEHRIHFAPDVLEAIAKDKKHFPGGVIRFTPGESILEVVKNAPKKEVVFVGKEGTVSRSFARSLGILGIKFSRVDLAQDAVAAAREGKTLLVIDFGEKQNAEASARHDAKNILRSI